MQMLQGDVLIMTHPPEQSLFMHLSIERNRQDLMQ